MVWGVSGRGTSDFFSLSGPVSLTSISSDHSGNDIMGLPEVSEASEVNFGKATVSYALTVSLKCQYKLQCVLFFESFYLVICFLAFTGTRHVD